MNKRLVVPALLLLGALVFLLWPAPAPLNLSEFYLLPAPVSSLPQRLDARLLDQPLAGYPYRVHLADPARLQTLSVVDFTQALRTQLNAPEPGPLQFFALQAEDVREMKELRWSFDRTLNGAERSKALHLTVPVRRFSLNGTPMNCRELTDFLHYANDNFIGPGLIVTEAELAQIAACEGQPDLFAPRWWEFRN
ncbi:hypothetical protein GCM10027046_05230 [Uliginosibacterium flavum]